MARQRFTLPWRRQPTQAPQVPDEPLKGIPDAVGVDETDAGITSSYLGNHYDLRGNLKGMNFDEILMDKEVHINDIYR